MVTTRAARAAFDRSAAPASGLLLLGTIVLWRRLGANGGAVWRRTHACYEDGGYVYHAAAARETWEQAAAVS
jgi:hypothetical protein